MVDFMSGRRNWSRKTWTKREILSRSELGTAGRPESLYLNDLVDLLSERLERKEIEVLALST